MTGANIVTATVENEGSFFALNTLVQVSDRVDLQIVTTTTAANGEFSVQLSAIPIEIEFFNQVEPLTSVTAALIPEPNTALLLSLGLTGLAAKRRRSLRS